MKKYDFVAKTSSHELSKVIKKSVVELPKRFFVVYTGQHKVLELSGVGKITIGHEYEVSEKIANSVRQMPDWNIITR